MIWFGSAILLGLFSSFHCLGMCGPILAILPWNKKKEGLLTACTLHHLGRISSYALLGVLSGLVGKSLILFGLQQWLSILSGILLLLLIIFRTKFTKGLSHLIRPLSKVSKSKFIPKEFKLFNIGVLNGLLPCGMVYAAMASSISSGSWQLSVLYMIGFGIGTLPVLFSFSLFNEWFSTKISGKWQLLPKYFLVVLAIVFILRGLNLGIPYLSPEIVRDNTEVKCH